MTASDRTGLALRHSVHGGHSGSTITFVESYYEPSPVPSDTDLWPGELPFTAFGQWGSGALDLRVFDQNVWWVNREGIPYLLDMMDAAYIQNVVRFLVSHAETFYNANVVRAAWTTLGNLLDGKEDSEVLAHAFGGGIVDVDSDTWLESTPLMRRLRTLQTRGIAP